MDNEEISIIYTGVFVFCLLILLFTSYNFKDNIPALVITYGVMVITGLSVFHALGSVQDFIDDSRTDDYE
jgi:hypothetical protein